ncbi:trigger factor [Candidatus Uhrbacteria bacterium]|nr:trigger factor [Candidatus Uhrbacteria bacterium]
MKVRSSEVEKGVLSITIEVPAEDHRSYLDSAAKEISQHHPVPGFRPGNVPYDVLVGRVGAQAILEQAAEAMVSSTYSKAIEQEKFEVVGVPRIQVEMLAPGNPFVYTATVPLLPEVTIVDPATVTVSSPAVEVSESDIDRVVEDLREMLATEAAVSRPATVSDLVIVDLSMTQGGVAVDGGAVKDHKVFLDKEHYIPGLTKELVGASAGETKTFTLPFPEQHYQKNLAGKNVDFSVTIKQVFERAKPDVDDAFAQKVGQKDLSALRTLLKGNLTTDRQKKEDDRQEREIIEQMIKKSKFTDIPEDLVTQEANRMMEELEQNVSKQGGEFNEYLASINKTHDQVYLDFAPQALERVKGALLLRAIALEHDISATDAEIDESVKKAQQEYRNDAEVQKKIHSAEMREHARVMLRNRKAIGWIKQNVKQAPI